MVINLETSSHFFPILRNPFSKPFVHLDCRIEIDFLLILKIKLKYYSKFIVN